MNCTLCAQPILGNLVASFVGIPGNYHPNCNPHTIAASNAVTGTINIVPTSSPITLLSQADVEKLIQDAIWKNKSRYGR